MQGNRSRDTRCELVVRRALHARGYRYFVHRRPIPGLRRTADIVFPTVKLAVFIDGCFWHGCPRHHRLPASHQDYWEAKIATNRARDEATDRALADHGWTVIRVWEHEAVDEVVEQIATTASRLRAGRTPAAVGPSPRRDASR